MMNEFINNLKFRKIRRKQSGITLIALVITIVILLLLAGIVVTAITGENGLFGIAKEARDKTEYASAKELLNNKIMEAQVESVEKNKEFTIIDIYEVIEKASDFTIEQYYLKETATAKTEAMKTGIENNKSTLAGLVVKVNQYAKYKFLIGENGALIGATDDEKPKKMDDFTDIKVYESSLGINTKNETNLVLNTPNFCLYKDETGQIMVQGANGNITYESEDETIATVSKTGLVTAVGNSGTTKIIISSNGKSVECDIVIRQNVSSICIANSGSNIKAYKNLPLQLEVTTTPTDNTEKLIFTSSDESIATVDVNTGVVNVIQENKTVTITVKGERSNVSATCTIETKGEVQELTASQISSNLDTYFGRQVLNYASSTVTDTDKTAERTWRIFYIDVEGKYSRNGEKNVIYLKADDTKTSQGQTVVSSNYTPYDSTTNTGTYMREMNPDWAQKCTLTEANWTQAMKVSAWFLDPSKWTKYANSNASYAFGSHSMEMYIDALNESGKIAQVTGDANVKWQYEYVNASNGYRYHDGSTWRTWGYHNLPADGDNTYYPAASPTADGGVVWYVQPARAVSNGGLSDGTTTYSNPIVALAPGFKPAIAK